ncbi:MAG: nicotinate (nicotinamide) nucleotide adenylyltransferase [Phycisphaerae bacterium]
MAKILIFGGTFDPVHNGHLQIARAALVRLHADRVVFIPANTSPHKLSANTSSATPQQRLAMLRLAIGEDPSLEVSDVELQRPPPSYTIDTLSIMQRDHPDDLLTLLIGADQLSALHTWREITTILKNTPIAVLPRPGYRIPEESPHIPLHLWNQVRAGVLAIPKYAISATAIRQRLGQALPVINQIPPAVLDYIWRHRLYGCTTVSTPERHIP